MSPKTADALTYVAAILIAVFFAAPFVWMISLSLRTPAEVYLGAARLIPQEPTLANFGIVFRDPAFAFYLWNAVKLAALGGAGALLAAIPAAYAASRLDFRGKAAVMIGLLSVQMVSPLVILIPLYRWMDGLGLLDTDLAVIAVYAAIGTPLATWLLKATFDAIPPEIEHCAAIDGASRLQIVMKITLPLAAPGLASAFILMMVMNWSQFLVPFILLESDGSWPISVAIFNFAGSTSASTTQVLAAACLVSVAPALVIFMALQRTIVRALVAGAMKG